MKKDFDFNLLSGMSYEQKIQVSQALAKRANTRMKALESKGINYYAYENAKRFLRGQDRNRYYEGKKLTPAQLDRQLKSLQKFLQAKTSTLRGLREVDNAKIEAFRAKGFDVKNPNDLFNFLSSNQFKRMSKLMDSNQIVEDFLEASDEGVPSDEIMNAYKTYIESQYTQNEIRELRRGGLY